jgi:hypothetical protein
MVPERNHDISNRDINDLVDKQFLGVVVAVDDPRKEGRARVRVETIYDDLEVNDIPWAYPKSKSMIFGKEGKAGAISIPKIGSIVAVRFDNGNPYSPEYFAIHELAQDIKDELNSEYEGSHFVLYDGDQELKVWFSVTKGLTLVVKDASINIKQNLITLKVGDGKDTGKVVIDAPNIELGAGAAQSLIKGEAFMNFFNAHTHTGPVGPPAAPMTSAQLSMTSKTK